jgi:hypothetical protein
VFLLPIAIRRNPLFRWDRLIDLFQHWEIKQFLCWKEVLYLAPERGEPFYRLSAVMEKCVYVIAALGLLEHLWLWLTQVDTSYLRPIISIEGFATIVLTWRYVKATNRAAAQALEKEITSKLKS